MSPRPDEPSRTTLDPPDGAPAPAGTVESVSTRVLVNGGVRECRACEATIAAGTRYRCVTVRDGDGAVSEVPFCGDDCADAVTERESVTRR
jgi:hypothetical protein